MKKLFTLLTMLIVAISTSWAQDFIELRTVDFTALPQTTFNDGKNTVTTEGYTDVEFWKKSGKTLTLNATDGEGIAFGGQNIAKDHLVAIPLTGVNGSLKVTLYHSYSSGKANYKIAYTVGTTVSAGSSGTGYNSNQQQPKDANNADTNCSYTYTGLTSENIVLYIGEASSNFPLLKKVVIETLAPSVVDPVFSLSKSSIGTDETAQINVGTKTGLDGITLSDIAYGTAGVVTVNESGVVTPVAAGTTTITFSSAAVDGKYNAGSGNLSITVTAPVVKTPTLTEGGGFVDSKTVEIACETDGATIKYSTDNENWSDYTEPLTITETTTVYAKATLSGYTDSEVASETYTKAVPHTWATVSTATTWDWTKLTGANSELTDATTPKKNEEFLMGDMDGLVLTQNIGYDPSTFNADALKLIAQYAVRDKKYAQATQVKFQTSVPGTVKVYYSNTGKDRPYRHVEVNGVLSAEGSASTTQTETEEIAVAAGEVTIKVYIPDAESPQAGNNDVVGYTMARIYKIVFTPATATTINLNAKGYATYSQATDFMFAGATGYKMTLDEDAATITGTAVTGKIAAGEGILFKGEANATVTILETTGATALADNSLSGTTTASGDKADVPSICYTLSGDTFKKFTGTSFNDNKAYIEGTKTLSSLTIVFEGEEATSVEAIAEAAEAAVPVKVIKNGKLYIGNYNVAGQQVK